MFPDNYVKPYDKNKVVLRNKQDATRYSLISSLKLCIR